MARVVWGDAGTTRRARLDPQARAALRLTGAVEPGTGETAGQGGDRAGHEAGTPGWRPRVEPRRCGWTPGAVESREDISISIRLDFVLYWDGWWFTRDDLLELISMKQSWSRPRRVLPALLVASLVPVLSAVPALAVTGTWAPHVALSAPGPYPVHLISEPAVGMDAAGGAVSVFVPANAGTTIAAAFRAAGGGWVPSAQLSPAGGDRVQADRT